MRRTREAEPDADGPAGHGSRTPESATFETTRVGEGRRPPIFAAAFVLLVGGMVAIGLTGREPVDPPPVAPLGSAAPSPDSPPVVDRDGNDVTGAASRSVGRPGVFFPLLDASWEDVR